MCLWTSRGGEAAVVSAHEDPASDCEDTKPVMVLAPKGLMAAGFGCRQ